MTRNGDATTSLPWIQLCSLLLACLVFYVPALYAELPSKPSYLEGRPVTKRLSKMPRDSTKSAFDYSRFVTRLPPTEKPAAEEIPVLGQRTTGLLTSERYPNRSSLLRLADVEEILALPKSRLSRPVALPNLREFSTELPNPLDVRPSSTLPIRSSPTAIDSSANENVEISDGPKIDLLEPQVSGAPGDSAESLQGDNSILAPKPVSLQSTSQRLDEDIEADLLATPPQYIDGLPWWRRSMQSSLRTTSDDLPVSLNALLVGALSNSAEIQVISDAPLITETEITTADAAFDWSSFVNARWDDVSEPVGSTLLTGGPDRLLDHTASVEFGLRRKNTLGGEFSVGQRFGHQNSNSLFFIPQDQGTSRLTLSYNQPLLRGSGKVYNTSMTVLAKLRTKLERNEFERQLQDHLLLITQEYWNLYFERAKYLQQLRLLQSGQQILQELESREEVDALQSQVVRAKAAVANREAQLVRGRLTLRMVEARIRSLVNDPALGGTLSTELIPQEFLSPSRLVVSLSDAVAEALRNRPEVDAAIQQVKSASVQMNMSKRDTLPLLDVVLETYAAGLEGRSNVGQAFQEQFTEGEPSYGIGLQYEYPIWNRAANARLQKRRLELRRLQHQFRRTVETLKLEVELAVHQVDAAFEALGAKRKAMEAAAIEVAYLFDRWQLLPTDNGSASLLLEDLLAAQDRLTDGELGLLQALLDHNLAAVTYRRAIGTLLSHHQVNIDRNCNCNLPQQELHQSGALQYSLDQELMTMPMESYPEGGQQLPSPGIAPDTRQLLPPEMQPTANSSANSKPAEDGPAWGTVDQDRRPGIAAGFPPVQQSPVWRDSVTPRFGPTNVHAVRPTGQRSASIGPKSPAR